MENQQHIISLWFGNIVNNIHRKNANFKLQMYKMSQSFYKRERGERERGGTTQLSFIAPQFFLKQTAVCSQNRRTIWIIWLDKPRLTIIKDNRDIWYLKRRFFISGLLSGRELFPTRRAECVQGRYQSVSWWPCQKAARCGQNHE